MTIPAVILLSDNNGEEFSPEQENPLARNDWFFAQRVFPINKSTKMLMKLSENRRLRSGNRLLKINMGVNSGNLPVL